MRTLVKGLLILAVLLEPAAAQGNDHYVVRYFIPYTAGTSDDGGYKYYYEMCRAGSRGPCADDQYFGPVPDWAVFLASCDNYGENCFLPSDSPDCIDISKYPSMKKRLYESGERGLCIWSENSQHPCHGYPANYRYYDNTGGCYPLQEFDRLHLQGCLNFTEYSKLMEGSVSSTRLNPVLQKFSFSKISEVTPCGGNTFFKEVDRYTGDCDCGGKHDIYWPPTEDCYRSNTQGPCNVGQWLVLDSQGIPHCEDTICLVSGDHVMLRNPKTGFVGCFKIETHGYDLYDSNVGDSIQLENLTEKGPCKEKQFLVRQDIYPESLMCRYAIACGIGSHLRPVRSCVPGSKLVLSGQCKKIYYG